MMITFEYCLKNGYARCIFKMHDEEYCLQARLVEPKKCQKDANYRNKLWQQEGAIKFIKKIKRCDHGMWEDANFDVNKKAFDEFNKRTCESIFFKEARKHKIRIIGVGKT